eukprot:scpid19236/ scgid30660/ 
MVEFGRSHIIQMTEESEQASLHFVIPDLDLVIVSSGNKQWLVAVKINSTNRSVMLIKPLNQCAHTIIPKLDISIVQARQDPGTVRMKSEALHASTLRFKFGQHFQFPRFSFSSRPAKSSK